MTPSCFVYHRRSLYQGTAGDIVQADSWRKGPVWVGPMMIVAELAFPPPEADDIELVQDQEGRQSSSDGLHLGSQRYVSFTWPDLWAIAPWMREYITHCIDGPGLGID